jgi:tetratricopeptide (TPR) repeat protein
MKKIIVILGIVLFSMNLNSQPVKYQSALDSLTLEGVRAINKGEFKRAIGLLDEAIEIDSSKWEIHYEKALAYYQIKEFDSVISILEPFIDNPNINDNFYQVLCSSYDIKKEYEKSKVLYDTALKKFPNSGKLYMEYAIHNFENENNLMAMALWQRGIEVDPGYENNYYWLSKYLYFTGEYAWTIMYGEVFMNMSHSALRLDDMSTYINEAYLSGLYHEVDSNTTDVQFTNIKIISKNLYERDNLPFEVGFDLVMKQAVEDLLPAEKSDIKIDDLYKIRKHFIEIWYKDKWNKKFSNPLLDHHKKMIEEGHFEAYNYWLFNSVRKKESEEWVKENKKKLEDFGSFMVKNQLRINKGNYFTQEKYVREY